MTVYTIFGQFCQRCEKNPKIDQNYQIDSKKSLTESFQIFQ